MRRSRFDQQRGQGLTEYGLILVLVAIVVVAILTILGPQVGGIFSEIVTSLDGATTNVNNGGGGAPPPAGAMITSASLQTRVGDVVTLNVVVDTDTTITLTDNQGGPASTHSCTAGVTCTPSITVGGSGSGTITVSAPGNSQGVFYIARP